MLDPDADAPPFNPLPPAVILLVLVIGAVEVLFQLGEAGILGGAGGKTWRIEMADQYGFSNAAAHWMWENGRYPAQYMIRFVSYIFVHTNFVSALFSVVFVLALGKFVGERVSSLALLVIFFGSGIIAAVIQAIVMGPTLAMLGAGAASYGLIGGLSWILFSEQRAAGESGVRAFRLIGALAVLLGVFFLLFGGHDWFERLVGFAVGFALTAFLRPGVGLDIRYWVWRMRGR